MGTARISGKKIIPLRGKGRKDYHIIRGIVLLFFHIDRDLEECGKLPYMIVLGRVERKGFGNDSYFSNKGTEPPGNILFPFGIN
jgi:hypothetical protein